MKIQDLTKLGVTLAEMVDIVKMEEANFHEITKFWTDEDEFAASEEMHNIYDGWQANYRKMNNDRGLVFYNGFVMNGKVYVYYNADGVDVIKEETLGTSLHNGGGYEAMFTKDSEDKIYLHIAKKNMFDFNRVRKYNKLHNQDKHHYNRILVDAYDV